MVGEPYRAPLPISDHDFRLLVIRAIQRSWILYRALRGACDALSSDIDQQVQEIAPRCIHYRKPAYPLPGKSDYLLPWAIMEDEPSLSPRTILQNCLRKPGIGVLTEA